MLEIVKRKAMGPSESVRVRRISGPETDCALRRGRTLCGFAGPEPGGVAVRRDVLSGASWRSPCRVLRRSSGGPRRSRKGGHGGNGAHRPVLKHGPRSLTWVRAGRWETGGGLSKDP